MLSGQTGVNNSQCRDGGVGGVGDGYRRGSKRGRPAHSVERHGFRFT